MMAAKQRRGWHAVTVRLGVVLGLGSGLLGGCATGGPPEALRPRLTQSDSPSWQETACESGNAQACSALGVRSFEGQGVTQDSTRATALFSRACEGGVSWGCDAVNKARFSRP